MLKISRRSRFLAVSAAATAAVAAACADVNSPHQPGDDDVGQEALAAYITSSIVVPTAHGLLMAGDSTRGRLTPDGLHFDARPHPRVLGPVKNGGKDFHDRLRLPSGRRQTVTYKDSTGARQTASLVYDRTGRRPQFVLRFRNGKPLDAMELRYGKDRLQQAVFASFDTAAARGRVAVQVNVSFDQNGHAVANSRRPVLRQLADLTATVGQFFAPSVAHAEPIPASLDGDPCATCTPLFWTAAALSAGAAAAAAAEATAVALCYSGDLVFCLELESLHTATVRAIAAATRAWADYVACKARGGGDEMNLRPDGAGGHLHPASLSADRVNPWRLTSASYSPRTATECEDPAPGGAGGDGGGGGAHGCHTEHWIVQISYDGGLTWEDLWEDDVTVCDYIL